MTEVTIRIPTPLRGFVGGKDQVAVPGATVREALAALTAGQEAFRDRLFTAEGELRRFVNVYLGRDDVRRLGGLEAAVPAGATLTLMVALAGG
ncbi:MoaD/ThiS family protein [Azospirillum sp. CT11-132]|uniref:MoaD/ThiS family protein n=1 Tax=unclassified Azospirillum TaxID=2630922 RepID=UPI000D60D237|nr:MULTISPECIES: MoaD/ThiS family protein [unclassified Azospirillum]PWC61189.1 thiamine biosynthesis protein ThiS [Azospirillum sp. TSH7]PWC62036.1 thiamine biosynthesis protein ThiS [Azospirillum sp. TSH20]PWC85398.1 thiamine biosynthesis protein ThiS [Azospirillum sp. TSO5]